MRCTLDDIDEVERIIGHPSVFFTAKDDVEMSPLDLACEALRDKRFIVVRPHEDTLFLFIRMNLITYEMHVCIVKGPARKEGRKSAIKAARWLFENTECQKIISYIPEFHTPSLMYAKVCGMTEEGRLKEAFLVNGTLHDLIVVGATKKHLENLHSEVS